VLLRPLPVLRGNESVPTIFRNQTAVCDTTSYFGPQDYSQRFGVLRDMTFGLGEEPCWNAHWHFSAWREAYAPSLGQVGQARTRSPSKKGKRMPCILKGRSRRISSLQG
jgi:hypothetical protein